MESIVKTIATTHKWGYIASREYCQEHTCKVREFEGDNTAVDAIVARNVYDAVASGYAYHKKGAECWVNHHFLPNPYPNGGNDHMRRMEWWEMLNTTREETKSYAKIKNFCEVLVSLPETLGVRVYAEFAYSKWYASAYTYIAAHRRVPVWCIQDLENTRGRRLNKALHSSHENIADRLRHTRMAKEFDESTTGTPYRRLQAITNCPPETIRPKQTHVTGRTTQEANAQRA